MLYKWFLSFIGNFRPTKGWKYMSVTRELKSVNWSDEVSIKLTVGDLAAWKPLKVNVQDPNDRTHIFSEYHAPALKYGKLIPRLMVHSYSGKNGLQRRTVEMEFFVRTYDDIAEKDLMVTTQHIRFEVWGPDLDVINDPISARDGLTVILGSIVGILSRNITTGVGDTAFFDGLLGGSTDLGN